MALRTKPTPWWIRSLGVREEQPKRTKREHNSAKLRRDHDASRLGMRRPAETDRGRSRERHPRAGLVTPRPGDPGLRASGITTRMRRQLRLRRAADPNGPATRRRPEGGTMPSG